MAFAEDSVAKEQAMTLLLHHEGWEPRRAVDTGTVPASIRASVWIRRGHL